MTLEQAMNFIHATGNLSRPGLERMTELMGYLGNPQDKLKFVHVTGTNGKGSVCTMLASILVEAGYKTGLYTSPHLIKINERMQINGNLITDEEFASLAEKIEPYINKMQDKPTEFERITAMAFLYFYIKKCDIVVLEVGLGGRLDATNIIKKPELSAIVNIGIEHTEWLGNTLEKIAFEKGGIIKPNCPVVLYKQSKEVENVIKDICKEKNCNLSITEEVNVTNRNIDGQYLTYKNYKDIFIKLIGTYQAKNSAVALEAIETLKKCGWGIGNDDVYSGMKKAKWPARLEVISKDRLILLDGGHNLNGVEELYNSLITFFPDKKFTFVMGVMKDKDYSDMAKTLEPIANRIIVESPNYYRAMPSHELKEVLEKKIKIPVIDGKTVQDAIKMAFTTSSDEPICIFGSLYQVEEVREFFNN